MSNLSIVFCSKQNAKIKRKSPETFEPFHLETQKNRTDKLSIRLLDTADEEITISKVTFK